MIIVLKQDAPEAKVHEFWCELEGMGLQINDSKGSDTHILGLIGDTKAIAESWVLANPVVETCRRVSEPYKKANRKFHPQDSIIEVGADKRLVGGGHFAKMVHNGIEYGMMQAFGEGFATMVKSDLIKDPAAVMSSWRDGSVVQSWLLDLLAIAFKSDPTLQSMPPVANESGEAKWMIEAALELGVPTPATAAALYARQTSRGGADDILRVVSTMRAQFGGHVTKIDEIATH